jgi:hypothetical protein
MKKMKSTSLFFLACCYVALPYVTGFWLALFFVRLITFGIKDAILFLPRSDFYILLVPILILYLIFIIIAFLFRINTPDLGFKGFTEIIRRQIGRKK